jgi:single-strand DNA-binding protein
MAFGFTVVVLGNLGRDPEISEVGQSNTAMAKFSMAVKVGGRDDPPEWVQVTAFGRLADFAEQYLNKGTGVQVSGTAKINRWQGNDGVEKAALDVVAYDIKFAGSGGDSDSGGGNQRRSRQSPPRETKKEEEIPF